jgi:hypothetical protein
MKYGFVRRLLLSCMLLMTTNSYAGIISYEDWHYDGDTLGGLRQAVIAPNVYFALSTSSTLSITDEYVMSPGYHIATRGEYEGLLGSLLGTTGGADLHPYYGRGGFSGYPSFLGNPTSTRFRFLFADFATVGGYVHAGSYETNVQTSTGVGLYGSNVAGFVLVLDPNYVDPNTQVPEPSTLAIFALGMIGLASRRFKKHS